MSLGPVMVDLEGLALSEDERQLLMQPQVGGVILFSRNFESVTQLKALIDDIHALPRSRLLISVDHEGGRVQRFRDGFTSLPPAAALGRLYADDPAEARRAAMQIGWLLATELRSVGVDFSFAPVLDLGRGVSQVIGDRAFHRSPEVVADLAHHTMTGMHRAGMEAVGKHFPGHGAVEADSHVAVPVDEREVVDILAEDVLPFERMIHFDLAAIMPAHVVYPRADPRPAGFSRFWLREILRRRLQFQGAIFSDDLSMAAAHVAGDFPERARAALDAGCDMVLVCNHPEGAWEVVRDLEGYESSASLVRLMRMRGRGEVDYAALERSDSWRRAVSTARRLDDSPWLEMNV